MGFEAQGTGFASRSFSEGLAQGTGFASRSFGEGLAQRAQGSENGAESEEIGAEGFKNAWLIHLVSSFINLFVTFIK
jgi:hypothetical protein